MKVGSVCDFSVLENVSANLGTLNTLNMFSTRLESEFFEDVSANLEGREANAQTDEHRNKEVGALVIQGCKRILMYY